MIHSTTSVTYNPSYSSTYVESTPTIYYKAPPNAEGGFVSIKLKRRNMDDVEESENESSSGRYKDLWLD